MQPYQGRHPWCHLLKDRPSFCPDNAKLYLISCKQRLQRCFLAAQSKALPSPASFRSKKESDWQQRKFPLSTNETFCHDICSKLLYYESKNYFLLMVNKIAHLVFCFTNCQLHDSRGIIVYCTVFPFCIKQTFIQCFFPGFTHCDCVCHQITGSQNH